jgi:transcriptional regulator with XRE-family HTH domain
MPRAAQLGNALRGLRKKNSWSLADVSRMTSISVSTLSKVENGRLSLTYDKLMDLSEGLGVDVSVFFSDTDRSQTVKPLGRRSLDGLDGGDIVETENYLHRYLHTELSRKKLIPVVVEIKARSMDEFGELVRHYGEEFVLVMEGEIEVHTELYEPQRLSAGQSIFLDSSMGHAYISVSEKNAVTLSVCMPPESSSAPDHHALSSLIAMKS